MANQYFAAGIETWQDGEYNRNIHAQFRYWRPDGLVYTYWDSNFPDPTMNIAGNVFWDSGFGNAVRSGINIGDVRTTHYVVSAGGNGRYNITWSARGGLRSDFWGDWSMDVEVHDFPTQPNAPSAANLTSDGTPHRAHSRVQTSYWGNNSSRRWYEVLWGSKAGTYVYDYNNDPGNMYWTLPYGSNDINACGVVLWYGRAYNNHQLYNDSGAMYVASPSAPVQTITAGSGTSPGVTISATPKYKGGTQNSSTCNNANLKHWQMGKMLSSDTGIPSTFQLDSNNDSSTTKVYTWDKSQFASGNSYKFMSRVTNEYGGTASLTSSVIYCPTGVSAALASRTTNSLTINCTYNYAGTIGAASGGTMSCYQLEWGDSEDSLTHNTGPQTSNVFSITGLTPGQVVYYKATAWNVYGLNNVSGVKNSMTVPRYEPAVGQIEIYPQCPGADVTIYVDHTGGLTEDELAVTSITADWRPVSSSQWTNLRTVTDLDIRTGQTYNMANLWTADAPEPGDYELRLTVSNGTDTNVSIWRLYAPTSAVLSRVSLVANQPIQIRATASMEGEISPYKYVFTTEGGAGTRVRTFEDTDTTITVISPNYLLYNTTYTVSAAIYNQMGLWKRTNSQSTKTDKRTHVYYLTPRKTSEGVMSFATNNGLGNFTEKLVTDVYYLTANALGNITREQVGVRMDNKRLKFISEPLHYRPESVASISFSNGKKLAYALDRTADVYKFGIWNGDNIETTFFDGSEWAMTSYDFPTQYIISATSVPAGQNLNASAPFSTTALVDVPLPERPTPAPATKLGTVFSAPYSTPNGTTTRVKVDYWSDGTAQAFLLYSNSNYTQYWAARSYFAISDSSIAFSANVSGPQSNYVLATITFDYSLSGGTYSASAFTPTVPSFNAFDFYGSVTIPRVNNGGN